VLRAIYVIAWMSAGDWGLVGLSNSTPAVSASSKGRLMPADR
jgi:hypothetical protein